MGKKLAKKKLDISLAMCYNGYTLANRGRYVPRDVQTCQKDPYHV